jgi:ATP-dependent DNA helicase HFM1/MER3
MEHINSEIVLQTITDLTVAIEWLKSTFLYVRVNKNPGFYRIPRGLPKKEVDRKLEELCVSAIDLLDRNNLIYKIQGQDGFSVESTEFGRIMSRYFLAFETMKIFNQIRGTESLMEMLNLLSQCHEFKDFTFRTNDKKHLNQLNENLGNGLRYPIRGKVKTLNMKISW